MKVIKSLFLGAALVAGRTIQAQFKSSLMEMRPDDKPAKVDPNHVATCKTLATTIKDSKKSGKWKITDKDGKAVDGSESEAKKQLCTKQEGAGEPLAKKCMGDLSGIETDDDKAEVKSVQDFCNGGSSCCS